MKRVEISVGGWDHRALAQAIETAYSRFPGLDRQRNIIVQCANCLNYWLLDTWTESVPCQELNPWCDSITYCPDCS